ncbi:intraflagellar transport protein 43 [Aphelenchoides avenae]|nr:intraflagellar transport protein 43 [Aphelenchus avenae]
MAIDGASQAPHVPVSRVNAMQQIETIGLKNPELGKFDEIDISLLARYLCPEEEAQDENVRWTWDYIFASVSSEMREEWAMEEEAEDGIGDSVNHR